MNEQLPTYVQLQRQKIIYIYDYYDQPLFYYAMVNQQGYLFIWNDDDDYWLIKATEPELLMSKTMAWHELFDYFVNSNRVNRLWIKSENNTIFAAYQPYDPKIDESPLPTRHDKIVDLTKNYYDFS